MTDAMNMGAITDRYSPGEATVAALRAGADLVVMPANTSKAVDGIVAAVDTGKLKRDRLDEAVARVILAARAQASDAPAGFEASPPQEFVEGSIVVAAKNCDALIGPAVRVSGRGIRNRSRRGTPASAA